ncbi:MAG: hypothetical protein JXQ71_07185 [Verrucomicrobia bacterium]|nr:hypothetical protein [Verrucomicrobiota bacterium]
MKTTPAHVAAATLAAFLTAAPRGAAVQPPPQPQPQPRAAGSAPAQTDAYLRYAHPTIREPFADLLNLEVPGEIRHQPLAALGYVDVTQTPFGADPTGATDATAAIQAAVTFARDHQMACLFPPGTYLLSDTLTCVQQLYRRANGRVFGGNRFPNMLVGSRAGTRRPRLLLAPRAAGFGNPARPKIFVHFWSRGYKNPTTADRVTDGLPPEVEQPNIGMNQMLVNLDIVIGEGNPGAIAVRHQAAEGSAIEDCTIDATHGLTGIQGGIGSGGSSAGVTVLGGRVGLDFTGYLSGTQPTPVITGFTLRGQTEAAIRSTSRQTLVAAGLKVFADRCAQPLIQVGTGLPANHGQLTLVDTEIQFAGAALAQNERVVVRSDRGVYLDNLFVRGATTVLLDPEQNQDLAGNPGGWLRVRQFAVPSAPRANQGRTYRYPVCVDGRPVQRLHAPAPEQLPPAGLQTRHLWTQPFPSFESPGAASVKAAPYHAKGDGRTDDTAAIQRAIDEREIVFLPKGCYLLTRTLDLKPHTKLVGVGQTISILVPAPAGAFADPANPAPMVRTADAAGASTVLAFLGLHTPARVEGAQSLHWRCGGDSVFRAVEIRGRTGVSPAPVMISGHGGGNWYNFRHGSARLLVDGAQGPLRFYQFSVQQVTSELRDARHVSFFGTKYEGNNPMLVVRDSDHIRLFGHGGNAKGRPNASLFVFERTPNFLLANGVDGPTRIGSKSLSHWEGSTDPRLWHFLIDRPATGSEIKTAPLDRPVVYVRGHPDAAPRTP